MWKDDKRWSDRFLNEIKSLIGLHIISEPPIEEDAERNTDLMVLDMQSVRIACRVRRFCYYQNQQYRNEITIRIGRPSGVKTELRKIIEGWGDYMFYGFSNESETALLQWVIIDLKALRGWIFDQIINNGNPPWVVQNNKDNSSCFLVINLINMPQDVIFAKS